jgi:hypothetical protein
MGGLTNPLLDEINGLSPGAKAALQSAHNAGTSQATAPAMPTLAPPNPGFAAARQSAQPSPAPSTDRMLPPSQESTVPSIGLSSPQPQVKAPLGTSTGDMLKRSQDMTNGPGINHIAKSIEGTDWGQRHPFLSKVAGYGLQVPAMIADTVAESASPIARMALSNVPGTYAHHFAELRNDNRAVNQDVENEQKQATTGATQAEIPLRQAQTEEVREKPDMAQAKLDQTQQLHDQQLREHGFKMDDQGKVVPLEYGEMSEPQQAVHDLKASQEELADAQTAFKKAQTSGIPAQLQMAQQRIQTAQQNARTAMGRLGISARSEEFREEQAKDKSENPAIPQVAQGRAYQGKAILESAQDLKGFIDKNPAVFGNLGSYWKQFTNNTPISDPAASKAMTKLASFAALQPALHGMRSHQAMQEFEKMIGGIPKNGESLKAAIDGITESAAQPMIDVATPHHGAQPQGGGAPPARPSSVPAGYNWNPQGNGGKGSWQPPKQ